MALYGQKDLRLTGRSVRVHALTTFDCHKRLNTVIRILVRRKRKPLRLFQPSSTIEMSGIARTYGKILPWQYGQFTRSSTTAVLRRSLLRSTTSASYRAFVSTPGYLTRKPSAISKRLPDPEQNPHRFRDFDLEGKVFVVTGGGRGLGLTLAEVLVEAGGKGMFMSQGNSEAYDRSVLSR